MKKSLFLIVITLFVFSCSWFYLEHSNPVDPLYTGVTGDAGDTEGLTLLENLVAYYGFNDNTGVTVKEELGAFEGTINGASYTAAGKIDGAYNYDNSNIYVIDSSAELRFDSNQDHSFSFWLKLDSLDVQQSIIRRRTSNQGHQVFCMYVGNDNKIYSDVVYDSGGNSLLKGSTELTVGVWYHIVIVNDFGGNRCIYINNYEEANTSLSQFDIGGGTLEVHPIYFGSKYEDTEFLNGQIDEIGIWDKALTSLEVSALYNSGSGLSYPFTN